MFNCLTRPRISTMASSHLCARTRFVIVASSVDRFALGLVYFVAVDPTIIERGGDH